MITVRPVHSIGAWARRWGAVAVRRLRSRTTVVAAAIAKPMSDVSTSTTSAKPRAWAIDERVVRRVVPLLMLPSNRKTGSVQHERVDVRGGHDHARHRVSSRPVGNDSTSCTTSTRYSGPR